MHPPADTFGRVHILMAMDLKQLPPATANPVFLAEDTEFRKEFEFRVLTENRRLVQAKNEAEENMLQEFQQVLEDVAYGRDTPLVRKTVVEAYVRGACYTRHTAKFEGSTACVAKRRYRDRWNGKLLTRIGQACKRCLRVKGVFLMRGSQNQWVRDEAAREIRRSVRSQCLSVLRLAGQWRDDPPLPKQTRPHCMRVMLVANLDVPNAFANGASGRLVSWSPEKGADGEPVKSVRSGQTCPRCRPDSIMKKLTTARRRILCQTKTSWT